MTYTLPANNNTKEENQLLPMWFIIIFLAVVIIIAYLFFPQKSLHQQLIATTKPEPIALYYLTQLVDRYPDKYPLRIALTRQQIGLYHWDLAEEQIRILEKNPELKTQTNILRFELGYTQAFQMKPGPVQKQAFADLGKEVESFTKQPLSQDELLNLATMALSLGKPGVALTFYERLTNITDPVLLRKIARTALETSQYATSAKYYMLAYQHGKTVADRRFDVVSALKALQAGSLFKEGMTIVDRLSDDVLNDKSMLIFITRFTLAAGRPDQAQIYVKRALLMNGARYL